MKQQAFTPLRKYMVKVWLAPFLKIFECIFELIIPLIVALIIDKGIKDADMGYILVMGAIMLGLGVLGFASTMITQYLAARVSSDYSFDLKAVIFRHMHALDEKTLGDFGKQKALNIVGNDVFALQNGVAMFMRLLGRAPFLVVGSVIAAFIVDWRAGLIVLAVLLLSSAVVFLVMFLTPKRYAAMQNALDRISGLTDDDLTGARVIRAFGREGYENGRYDQATTSYKKKVMSISRLNSLMNPLTFAFVNLGVLLIVYLGGVTVNAGELSTGQVVALLSYLTTSLTALIMLSHLIFSFSRALASKKRIDSFLALVPSIVSGTLIPAGDPADGEVLLSFDDVSLSFGGELAVKDVSFTLKAGEKLGIIGGTGSGKSSIINLIERFYDPTSGTIAYRGVGLRDINLGYLRRELALVAQKGTLYKGTVRSNLLLAKPEAGEEQIKRALDDSLSSEFLAHYQDGLDHEVEEGGENFSGGQKQRLLIAVALLHGGRILMLDDSTSALDYLSDLALRQNIAKRQGLATIIVSQRAASLKGCDEILVLDKGSVVARGTSEELLKSSPIYQEIYQTQVEEQ